MPVTKRWQAFGLAGVNFALLVALVACEPAVFGEMWATSWLAYAQLALLFVGVGILAWIAAVIVYRRRDRNVGDA